MAHARFYRSFPFALAFGIAVACSDAANRGDDALPAEDAALEPNEPDEPTSAGNLGVAPEPVPTVPSAPVGTIPGVASVSDSGAAQYSIPIEVPPGIAGMQPSISLEYSSDAGDGYAGVGWSISGFSSIARCRPNERDDGREGALQYDNSDPLCLDGMRMVVVAGSHGADSTEYRTRVDSYARIIAHGHMAAPGSWFEVRTKDGRILSYGLNPAQNPVRRRNGVTYEWALSQVVDRAGNMMQYSFASEELDYDDGHLDVVADVDHRPVRIDYTRHGVQQPQRAVTFEYSGITPRRITWSDGAPQRRSHLLTRIRTFAPGNALVHSYTLRYMDESVSHRSLLDELQQCDAHGACKPVTRFTWTLGDEGYEDVPRLEAWDFFEWPADNPNTWPYQRVMLDINGDSAQDILWLDGTVIFGGQDWRFWLSPAGNPDLNPTPDFDNGTPTGLDDIIDFPTIPNIAASFPAPWHRAQAVDFNGDDRDDLAFVPYDGPGDEFFFPGAQITVFAARPGATTPPGVGFERVEIQDQSDDLIYLGMFPDLDGDGLNDALLCRGPSVSDTHWVAARGVSVDPAGSFTSSHSLDFTGGGLDTGIRCDIYDEYLVLDADGNGGTDLLVIPAKNADGDIIPDDERNAYSRLAVDFDGGTALLVDAGLPRDRAQRWRLHKNSDGLGAVPEHPRAAAGPGLDKLLDLNADGLVDIMRYELASGDDLANMPAIVAIFGDDGYFDDDEAEDGGWRPWFNTGSGFARGEGFALEFTERRQLGTIVHSATPVDYNGDGRGDLLLPELDAQYNGGSDVVVLATREQGFELIDTEMWMEIPLWDGQAWRLQPAFDFDADGAQDLALFDSDSWDLRRGRATYTDLLSTVTDGLGKVTTFEWGRTMDAEEDQSEDVHEPSVGCQPDLRCDWSTRPVVKVMRADAGLATGETLDLRYRYFGGEADRHGRGSLGFDRVRIVEAHGSVVHNVTERWFDHQYDGTVDDFPFAGRVQHEIVHHNVAAAGEPDRWEVAQTDAYYQARPSLAFAGVHDVVLTRTHSRRWETEEPCAVMVDDVTVCEPDEIASLWYTVSDTVITDIDEYGDPGLVTQTVDDVWVEEVETEYAANDLDNWLIGRPTHVVVRSTDSGGFTQQREVDAGYDPATGLLAWTTRELGDPELEQRVDLVRDEYGNIEELTERAGLLTRTTTTTWDPEGVFPVDVANPLGHHDQLSLDPGLGIPTTHVDANGVTTIWTLDGFGRVVGQERRSSLLGPNDGANVTVTYAAVADPVGAMTVRVRVAGGTDSTVTLDRLGRQVREDWFGFAGVPAYTTTDYDQWLRAWRTSLPTALGKDPDGYTHVVYDALGRPRSEIEPDASFVSYAYETAPYGLRIDRTDEEAHTSSVEVDGLGRIFRTTDAASTVTCYAWGSFGHLREVQRDCMGANPPPATVLVHDAWGRKLSMSDEALGFSTYEYDGFDRLRETVDANEELTTYIYDLLDRPTSRTDSDGETTWIWDTVKLGLLTKSTSADQVERSQLYDGFSRPTKTTVTMPTGTANTFGFDRTYDAFSRLSVLKYPSSGATVHVEHVYDNYGNLDRVARTGGGTVYWDAQTVDVAGRVRAERYGNGVKTTRTYDELTSRPTALFTVNGSGSTIQQLEYEWTPAGDLHERRDLRLPLSPQTETLDYDALHRLTSIEIDSGASSLSDWAEYDALGNFTYRSDVGDYDYVGGKLTSAGVHTYLYDDAGNQTVRDAQVLTWTPQAMLRRLVAGAEAIDLEYDADGSRVRRTSSIGATTTTTVSIDGLYEREQSSAVTVPTKHKYYVWANGRVVTEIQRHQSGGVWQEARRYLHDDHLGSTDAITPDNGNVAQGERMSFDAWGRPRNPDNWTQTSTVAFALGVNVGYTGHMAQRDGGLVNMRGRMYDADVGRFVSPDPFVQDPLDLQSLNRYTYVRNNPLSRVDPSGFFDEDSSWTTSCNTLGGGCGGGGGSGGGGGGFGDPFGSSGSGFGAGADIPAGIGGHSAGSDRTASGSSLSAADTDRRVRATSGGTGLAGRFGHRSTSRGSEPPPSRAEMLACGVRCVYEREKALREEYGPPVVEALETTGKAVSVAGLVIFTAVALPEVVAAVGMSGTVVGLYISASGLLASLNSRCTSCAPTAGPVAGRVATRITLANGRTRFTPLRASGQPVLAGWNHVLDGHFNRAVTNNRSVFTITPGHLRTLLQSDTVVRSPVSSVTGGQFVRTVDVGYTIGTSSLNNGGGPTSVLRVFTDEAGNLITAFPL